MKFDGALSHMQLEGVLSKKKKNVCVCVCHFTNVECVLGPGLWERLGQVTDSEALVLLAL